MFLATTANKDFWDTKQEILFLGNWCRENSSEKETACQTMKSPWENPRHLYTAYHLIDSYTEKLFKTLNNHLNSVHDVTFSERYWRILLYVWLQRYVSVYYDRYICLKTALSKHPELETILLDPDSFRVPVNYNQYIHGILDDSYNLQLFSQILLDMDYRFPTIPHDNIFKSKTKKVLNTTKDCLHPMTEVDGILFYRLDFRHDNQEKSIIEHLNINTLKPPQNIWDPAIWPDSRPVFNQSRQSLSCLPAHDEFEILITKSLPNNFPTIYLEGYEQTRIQAINDYPFIPKMIVSNAHAWQSHEKFKFYSAEAAERGSRIICLQSAGAYSTHRLFPLLDHEKLISDKFMGWKREDKISDTNQNLPSLYTSGVLNKKNHMHYSGDQSKTILFFQSGPIDRYMGWLMGSPYRGGLSKEYLALQIRFLSSLPDGLRNNLYFRLKNQNEKVHAIQENISDIFPDIKFEYIANTPSSQRLLDESTRLAVFDHFTTGFFEALSANIPTILFWDPKHWEIKNDVKPYLAKLRKAEILWDSPEDAAGKIVDIYKDPLSWWNTDEIQKLRFEILDQYAHATDNWLDIWVDGLKREYQLSLQNNSPSRTISAQSAQTINFYNNSKPAKSIPINNCYVTAHKNSKAVQTNAALKIDPKNLVNTREDYLDWNVEQDKDNIRESAIYLRDKDAQHIYLPKFQSTEKATGFTNSPHTFWRKKSLEKFEIFLKKPLRGKILEIGAGTGWCSALISKKETVEEVYTLEYSRYCIEELIPQVHKSLMAESHKITRVLGSYNKMDCANAEFDFIISIGAIHHSENLLTTLKECYRVLKPGSYMLALEPCKYNSFTIEEQLAIDNALVRKERIKSKYGNISGTIKNKDNSDHLYRLCEYEASAIMAKFNPFPFLFDTNTENGELVSGDHIFKSNRVYNGFKPRVAYPYYSKKPSGANGPIFDNLMLILQKPLILS